LWPDAGVVERYDAPPGGQDIDESTVPILQVAAEVLQQHQRYRAGADFAVGVVDAVVGVDDLIGGGAVAECRCGGHVGFLSEWLSLVLGVRGHEQGVGVAVVWEAVRHLVDKFAGR
jgi:hypothetical protein